MVNGVYLAGAVRSAIGNFCGAFENLPAPALGSAVAKAAINRAGIPPDAVDEVIFGNVVSAGLGQNVARQVALGAGLKPSVGAMSVNKVCGSGLKAVMLAAQAIKCGDASVVLAGGTENMSRAPYLLERARNPRGAAPDEAACTAWFYLGQRSLTLADGARATLDLLACLRTGHTALPEYRLAVATLIRLRALKPDSLPGRLAQ